ncbi:MAG: membrane protein [Peptococcaceae bacterium BICA1-7]|nr:MAG: membrane protein [Peptococcaceae bacterium BICA1-7]HBV95455.1 lysine exporter LysO family protein [Desulfotomaculum sp.]
MTLFVMGAILFGVIIGRWFIPEAFTLYIDPVTTLALCVMLVGIGIDIGSKRETWGKLWEMGIKVFLVPVLVAAGSLAGAAAGGTIMGIPLNESTAIGAGFGWYSLSGVLLAKIYSVETGALAFLTNVARELIAFIIIPILAARSMGVVAVAPGGATTMDTTLPLIARVTDPETAIIAVVNGLVLSSMVPVLVPLFIGL